ncbi:MAG: DUF805 domain-containing protein [Pseudomonadota bacterium]
MSPTASIATCLRKYGTFSGRASRSEFWWFVGSCGVLNAALRLVGLQAPFILAITLPVLAVTSRRFHDIGKGTGWAIVVVPPLLYTLLPPAPPGVPVEIGGLIEISGAETSAILMLVTICNVIIFINLFREGVSGANRFGASPVDDQSGREVIPSAVSTGSGAGE